MLVLGEGHGPHLVVERLQLFLACGVDWADVEAGRALRQHHSSARPRPRRPRPAEAPAPGGGGGGHEPSLANWLPAGRMRGGFGSSYSPGLVVVVGRSKQTSDELAEWLLRGRHHTDGDRDGRTCGSGARDDASHGPGRSFMVAVCYQRI
jgi:hypothetical protein